MTLEGLWPIDELGIIPKLWHVKRYFLGFIFDQRVDGCLGCLGCWSWLWQLLSYQHPENLQSRGRRGGEANGARIRSTWLRRLAMLWWFCVMDFGKTHRTAGKNGAKRLKFRCQGRKGGRWSFPPVRSRPWTFWRRRGSSSAWAAGSWRWRSSLCDKKMSKLKCSTCILFII